MRLRISALAVAALAGAVACSGATPPASPAAGTPPPAPTTRATVTSGVPGCSMVTAPAPALGAVPTSMGSVPGTPFGVVVTADGRWSFVSLPGSGSVGVFRIGKSAVPSLVRQVDAGGQPFGEALTHDGRYLLVAEGAGVAVIRVSTAEQGAAGAGLGMLSDPAGSGAIEVAVSPDDRFAFVSLEGSASIAVFNLQRALAGGFGASDLVGAIPTGLAPVGMTLSPDGRWLYATSEIAGRALPAAGVGPEAQGTLSVISLRRAETDPPDSLASVMTAGCGPVRVITSGDGSVVWVTARESDSLLGFSAGRLLTDPVHSLIARVRVAAGDQLLLGATRGRRPGAAALTCGQTHADS